MLLMYRYVKNTYNAKSIFARYLGAGTNSVVRRRGFIRGGELFSRFSRNREWRSVCLLGTPSSLASRWKRCRWQSSAEARYCSNVTKKRCSNEIRLTWPTRRIYLTVHSWNIASCDKRPHARAQWDSNGRGSARKRREERAGKKRERKEEKKKRVHRERTRDKRDDSFKRSP